MDPISRASLPNIIPTTPKVGSAGALAPATSTATTAANAVLLTPLIPSALVDISPLGQFLSGVALSRRQLLALQGATEDASTADTPVNRDAALVAVAQQLTQSFAQLQTSGIDASQLSTDDPQDNLAQRYDLLAGDGTTDTAAALAQDGTLLTQAGLANIGIDLQTEQVNVPVLQAAYAADSNATLAALQQGTDVLAQVGAVLAQQQGAPVAITAAMQADLNGETTQLAAALAVDQQLLAQAQSPSTTAIDGQDLQQAALIAQRQLELQQQLETEELTMGLLEAQQQQAQQLEIAQGQQQAQRIDSQRSDSQRLNTEWQTQQQESVRLDALRQAQLQDQAHVTAATTAPQDNSTAQLADQAISTAASDMPLPANASPATTAQAQLAQQNTQAQQLAAQNAGQVVPPPSSQDPSVAAAIAAYNLNSSALNPGLMNRQHLAGDTARPLVTPVAPVQPVPAVKPI